ncbi:MAG: cytochrome c oxidase subunit 3 [Bryobacteraceae bacterium]
MRRAHLGMAMFLIAEAVFFFLLILAFVYFRAKGNLSIEVGSLDTALLLASSLSMWRAIGGSRVWQALTIVLGAAFLAGQGSQYVRLIRDGVTIGQGLFGTTFFTLVGAHGLHVLAGLVALAVVPSTALRTLALYWYFFAGVWVVIFLAAYVWGAA